MCGIHSAGCHALYREVTVIRLLCKNTIEEDILHYAETEQDLNLFDGMTVFVLCCVCSSR